VKLARLWEIRVRTPRLVLRLPTEEELLVLYHVAEGGIHPPEQMPFFFAWTDDLKEDSFLAFHRGAWDSWRPDLWTLNFVTFLDGRPIGTQGVSGEDFVTTRTVGSGSWLGEPFQSQGFGTEQRAGMLEFAFRGLGAEAAASGALEGNVRSQRIAERLGYHVTGTSQAAPRGEPVVQYDYRLERADWRSPIPVEIEGLEPCLQLFGALPLSG
jgi:RimJ/RimL family protein N-acetyltransferase